jgi:hypothetical protein
MGNNPKTAADLLAKAKASKPRETLLVPDDQGLLGRHDEVSAQIRVVRERNAGSISNQEVNALVAELEAIEEEMAESFTEFVFEAVGALAVHRLELAHPPTKEQRAAGYRINDLEFRYALMGASCVAPEGADAEFFRAYHEACGVATFEALWATCQTANMGRLSAPKAVTRRGSKTTSNVASESTPAPTESPEASSSDA